MKELLEKLSVALGHDGEINEAVDQWLDRVYNRYGYKGDNLTAYVKFAVSYWNNTGYIPLHKNH